MAREMKDSGFVWLGQIPHDWEIRKLKHYYTLKTGFTPDTKKQEYYDETGYDWVNISDLSDGATIYETRKKISQAYVDAFSPEQIPAGSLMYSFKLSVGQTSFAGKPLFTNEAIASFLDSETVDLHYLRYSSSFIIENAQTNIYNAKILNQDLINNAYVPFPPLAEQARIAAFLDRKCAEIDSVIADTQRTIEEYKKLKQSVITQAVTKGIRGERPMKDSGIEWIGKIPVEWGTKKIKFSADFIQIKYTSEDGTINYIGLENIVSWNGQYVETASDYDREQSLICEDGDILFGKLRPYLAKVYISTQKQCCSGEFAVIRAHKDVVTRFLWYQLISHGFIFMVDRSTYGTKMPRANVEFIKNVGVAIPSINEQREIIDYLDAKCGEMDKLISAKQQLLTELESYKKSVIYEYVTGKKEVPACQ